MYARRVLVRPGLGSPLRCTHSVSHAALVRDLLAAIGRLSASLSGRLHRSQRPELLLGTGTGSARPRVSAGVVPELLLSPGAPRLLGRHEKKEIVMT